MIPYFQLPLYEIGPLPLDPWGILVMIGFMVGLEVARARGLRLGLDVRDVVDGVVFTVLSGFVVGHLVDVFAYHPERLKEDWVDAIFLRWGFSSFGGFLGAVLGIVLFFRVIRKVPFWQHADVVMFGFPFGWVFGRLGCFMAHDHIGRLTTFPLSVTFPPDHFAAGQRFDLGLLEALWTMVICATFWASGRKPRPDRFFPMLWCFLYTPVRFGLDFLRNRDLPTADVRWAGLTPAQWGCIVMFAAGVWLFTRIRAAARAP